MSRLLCLATVIAALSACSTSSTVSRPTSGTSRPNPGTAATPAARSETDSADARAQTLDVMLERARNDRMAGNLAQAESTLEAALRIAPADPRLWLELAEIQIVAGELDEARTLANRALSLAGGNRQISEAALRIRAMTTR